MKGFLVGQTRISQAHLRTTRLDRALDFYSSVLGLKASHKPGVEAILSTMPEKRDLLVLSEDRSALPRLPQSIGLYHFALCYATRDDLAQARDRNLHNNHQSQTASYSKHANNYESEQLR